MDQIVKFKSDHIKIEVTSHFPHSLNQLTDFNVLSLKLKLKTSSTRIWSDYTSVKPMRGLRMAKNTDNGYFWSILTIFDT